MKLVDRALQRELLEYVGAFYPGSPDGHVLDERFPDRPALEVNVRYLEQHGLLDARWLSTLEGTSLHTTRIKAKGIDFLQDDGGLSAVLGVVTIKFHDETLKALISDRIQAAPDLPETTKAHYQRTLRELPGEATKHLVLQLMEKGLENWPAALRMLQTLLG